MFTVVIGHLSRMELKLYFVRIVFFIALLCDVVLETAQLSSVIMPNLKNSIDNQKIRSASVVVIFSDLMDSVSILTLHRVTLLITLYLL